MSKKKSNKIEIDILSDISDIQEGHSQVIPIVTENEDELSENYSIPESLPILSLRRLGAVPRLDYPHYGGPGEVHEADTRRGGRHGNTRCGTSEGVRRRAARTGRHVPHRHGSPHSQDARHAQRQPDRHPARPRKIEINEYLSSEPYFTATVTPLKDTTPASGNVEFEALVESIKDVALNIISVSPNIPKEASFAIKNIDSKRGIINFICSNLDFEDADRQRLLEAPGLLARARRLLEILVREQQARGAKEQDTEQGQTGHRPAAERILPPAADTHHPGGVGRQRGRSRNRPHARGGQDEEVEQRGGRNVQQGEPTSSRG